MPYDTETLKVLDNTDLQANKEKENMKNIACTADLNEI